MSELLRSLQGPRNRFPGPGKPSKERRQGYIKGAETDIPLVAFLDYFVSGIGYYQAIRYVWGTSNPSTFSVHVDAHTNLFIEASTSAKGCIWCQATGMLGKGDRVPALIPLEKAPPEPSLLIANRYRDKEEVERKDTPNQTVCTSGAVLQRVVGIQSLQQTANPELQVVANRTLILPKMRQVDVEEGTFSGKSFVADREHAKDRKLFSEKCLRRSPRRTINGKPETMQRLLRDRQCKHPRSLHRNS